EDETEHRRGEERDHDIRDRHKERVSIERRKRQSGIVQDRLEVVEGPLLWQEGRGYLTDFRTGLEGPKDHPEERERGEDSADSKYDIEQYPTHGDSSPARSDN